MQFLLGNIDIIQVEKDHFRKGQNSAMSNREVRRVITSGAQSNHIAPKDPSENHANTMGKRCGFRNGAVAGTFHVFELSKQWKFNAF